MKKLLLIAMMIGLGLQTFSYSPGAKTINPSHSFPGNLNALSLHDFLKLTPKKYYELTGKKMTLKEKLAFTILQSKLKKHLPDDKDVPRKNNLGMLSLLFGAGAWVFAFIPAIGVISLGFAVAAVVLGILGLGRKKGDTKSIIGLVLGGLFLLLVVVAIASFASGSWYK